jgi:hypothetical protein
LSQFGGAVNRAFKPRLDGDGGRMEELREGERVRITVAPPDGEAIESVSSL